MGFLVARNDKKDVGMTKKGFENGKNILGIGIVLCEDCVGFLVARNDKKNVRMTKKGT